MVRMTGKRRTRKGTEMYMRSSCRRTVRSRGHQPSQPLWDTAQSARPLWTQVPVPRQGSDVGFVLPRPGPHIGFVFSIAYLWLCSPRVLVFGEQSPRSCDSASPDATARSPTASHGDTSGQEGQGTCQVSHQRCDNTQSSEVTEVSKSCGQGRSWEMAQGDPCCRQTTQRADEGCHQHGGDAPTASQILISSQSTGDTSTPSTAAAVLKRAPRRVGNAKLCSLSESQHPEHGDGATSRDLGQRYLRVSKQISAALRGCARVDLAPQPQCCREGLQRAV